MNILCVLQCSILCLLFSPEAPADGVVRVEAVLVVLLELALVLVALRAVDVVALEVLALCDKMKHIQCRPYKMQ